MAKIPQKFMGLLGKFADSLDYNDLPKGWVENPEIVEAAGELYRDMGTESPFFKAWFGNWPAAKAYHEAVSGRPVVTLTGKEFQKDGVPLTEKVPAWYDEMFRGAVRSPELGDVILDLEGVKDSMGHGIGREKSAAFAAVPDIIRKGTVFDRQSNWKGRGYDTSVISAPVRIGDTDYAGEVVVKTGKDRQGLYLHEVENKKRLEDAFKTANGSAPQASRLILGQKLDDVKRSSKVVDGEGRPLVVHHNTDAVFDTFSTDKINSLGAYGEGFYFAEKPAPYGPHQMDVYLKGTYGLPEKRAARRAGLPVQDLDYVHVPDKGYWMVKEPNQIKSVQNRGTFNPDDPNIYKAFPWAMGGAGTAAALAPGEAQAAQKGESGDDAPWRNVMDEITRGLGTRNVLEGLGRGATPGLSDPGKTISDFFGLPVPETDMEKNMVFLEGGAAEAVPMLFGGGAFRLTAFLMVVFRDFRLSDMDVFSKGMRCAGGTCFSRGKRRRPGGCGGRGGESKRPCGRFFCGACAPGVLPGVFVFAGVFRGLFPSSAGPKREDAPGGGAFPRHVPL